MLSRVLGRARDPKQIESTYASAPTDFTNDYKAINTSLNNTSNSFTPVETTQTNDYVYNSYDLYNGNISRMVTVMRDASGNAIPVLARSFRYDQLNRIKEANAYGDNNVVTNNYWSTSGTNDLNSNYQEIFTYDWNGNIKTATRNGNLSGTHQQMDNMSYWYDYDANGKLENNKLEKATDAATALAADYGNDIDAGQGAMNYQYDEVGNLIADASEEIGKIEWNNQGKIAKITRTNGSTKADLEFLYNANGQRLAKIVKPRTGGNASTEENWEYTVYGGGSIYELNYSGSGSSWTMNYDLKEQMVEGGISYDQQAAVTRTFNGTATSNSMFDLVPQNTFTGTTQVPTVSSTHQERKLGNKLYELANHLGNVMSTVSDRRIAVGTGVVVNYYLPEVASYADYYAFGSTMSGRVWQGATKYRYGFNGQEKDDEIDEGMLDFGARIYNSALGKFLSVDPWAAKYVRQSPYVFAHNSPVALIDWMGLGDPPDGEEECCDEIPADAVLISAVDNHTSEKNKDTHVIICTYARSVPATAQDEGEMLVQYKKPADGQNYEVKMDNFRVYKTEYYTKKITSVTYYNDDDTQASTSTTEDSYYSGYELTSYYDLHTTYYEPNEITFCERVNGEWKCGQKEFVDGKGYVSIRQHSSGSQTVKHAQNKFLGRTQYSGIPDEAASIIQLGIDIRLGKLSSDNKPGRSLYSWPDLVLLGNYAKSVYEFIPDTGPDLVNDGLTVVGLVSIPVEITPAGAAAIGIGGWAFQKLISVQVSAQGRALMKQYNEAVLTQSTKGNWGTAVYKIK